MSSAKTATPPTETFSSSGRASTNTSRAGHETAERAEQRLARGDASGHRPVGTRKAERGQAHVAVTAAEAHGRRDEHADGQQQRDDHHHRQAA